MMRTCCLYAFLFSRKATIHLCHHRYKEQRPQIASKLASSVVFFAGTNQSSSMNEQQYEEQFQESTTTTAALPSSLSSPSFQVHDSITNTIIDRYDAFILDQYGVLHNGQDPLEGVLDCLQELAIRRGKRLVVLSNSPSSGKHNLARLEKLGLVPTHQLFFARGAITGGDQAIRYIRQHYSTNAATALFLTYRLPKVPSPALFLEECGNLPVTDNVEQADFVLLHGTEVLRGPGPDGEARETSLGNFIQDGKMTIIDPILAQCRERNLPMLCCNPDFVAVAPDGSQSFMPGTIAQHYQEMGGAVTSFGKPNVSFFEACLRELNVTDKSRVVHVGDSLHHDIAGANAVGIDSVFVVGGVHRQELGVALGVTPDTNALQDFFAKHSQIPTHVVPMFRL